MISVFVPLLLAALFPCTTPKEYRYDGHKVLHIAPNSSAQLEKVLALHHKFDVDVWRHPNKWNQTLDVYVTPDKMEAFLEELKQMNVDVRVWIHDLQRLIDEEKASLKRYVRHPKKQQSRNVFSKTYLFGNYLTNDETRVFLDEAISHSQSTGDVKAVKMVIGKTEEGRDIDLIHISKGDTTAKKKIFIDGGIHAREWISPSFVTYIIYKLVNEANTNDSRQLLDNFDWYIVPILNPDGYEYSHTNDRLWRKNRSTNRRCHGTDLNRNFGFNWNPSTGGSTNPCSTVFSGTQAFSEPESQALRDIIDQHKENTIAYITVHSYGQYWLYPWGYTSDLPDDVAHLDQAARAAVSALTATYGTDYIIGSSTNALYAAAGGSDDWAKGGAGVKYSYTLELRDKGSFILPVSQIEPTLKETWNGLIALCNEILHIEATK